VKAELLSNVDGIGGEPARRMQDTKQNRRRKFTKKTAIVEEKKNERKRRHEKGHRRVARNKN